MPHNGANIHVAKSLIVLFKRINMFQFRYLTQKPYVNSITHIVTRLLFLLEFTDVKKYMAGKSGQNQMPN